MSNIYFAHSGNSADRSDWQRLDDHLAQTAERAAAIGAALDLPLSARMAGAFHDFGKYDPAFDRVLRGENIRVDHSTAGGWHLCKLAPAAYTPIAEILAHAILGHHAGLPDTRGSDGSMDRRIDGFVDPIDPSISAAANVDLRPVAQELLAKFRPGNGFDLSVAGRMIFSCLVDADFRDTETFYDRLEGRQRDRDWPAFSAILPGLRAAFDAHMAGFGSDSDLNRLRATILSHVRQGAALPPGLFTLTVPTGGGKTLASMGFALDHAARHGHRRIIYAIPYTSIIDQTAAIFRSLFGDVVLEHHASIDAERPGQEGREKARLAMEDWAAPIVVTTNVQLFESLFASRPSRCRKLHNIAGSIIVLDEAQCLPRDLLLPVLRMLDTLAAHYGCTIVLCTATQPAFDSAQLKEGGLPLAGRELAPDPPALASRLRRARIVQGGPMPDADLISALGATPQGVIIVNSRTHALNLYEAAKAAGLEGLIHLTTRQYPAHRRRIIANIRDRLAAGTPCRVIATSLIEAGVDLDFPMGWRAEAGLDSIVQAAGRVNREGRRPPEDSTLTVFEAPDHPPHRQIAPLAMAMRSTASRYQDTELLSPEAIRDWFEQVYWRVGADRMGQAMADGFIAGRTGTNFPYRTTAAEFRMIEEMMMPVIIESDDIAKAAVYRLNEAEIGSGTLARALQPYTVQVPGRYRELLRQNGKGEFRAPALRGEQFFVLTDGSLYRKETGLWWEAADYLTDSIW